MWCHEESPLLRTSLGWIWKGKARLRYRIRSVFDGKDGCLRVTKHLIACDVPYNMICS